MPLLELYEEFSKLFKYGFTKIPVYSIKGIDIYCYKSAKKGSALYLLSGIHGEEPAGPNAIAQNISTIGALGMEIPVIVMPLLNPVGYLKNDRYPNEHRDWQKGHSVSDSEHYLTSLTNPNIARAAIPSSDIALQVTKCILGLMEEYPPLLTLDLHEDEALERSYIYSQGPKGAKDKVAKRVISILKESGIPLQRQGVTRFGELVKDGVVVDENGLPVKDGSIDELLGTADRIIVDGKVVEKPVSKTSLVIETPTINIPLKKRVFAQSNILKSLKELWTLANK